jgi:catechol 2,3-dioxygenase-like lactoylglutathione lyase family enzyme
MKLGDSVIELFDYKHPKGREPRADQNQSDYGLIHIGLEVENFEETYQDLKTRGVTFLGQPVEIRPGVFVAYFRGAESEVCEMREIT